MTRLRDLFSLITTPQNRPIPNSSQVANSTGGFTWQLDNWGRLDRFLILGSEGGTYYMSPRKLTVENAEAVIACITEDGLRVVETTIAISKSGRAPKNDPALFVLALCTSVGELDVRRAALAALPQVARTGTHLFHFMHFVEGMRGWGRSLRRGIGNWYNKMPAGKLAYQAIKYQRRDGWSHRDALRLAHPTATTDAHNAIYHWITQGWEDVGKQPHPDDALKLIWAFERAKRAETGHEIRGLIRDYGLPWEAVPTEFLRDADTWAMLLPKLPMTAMIRNLARLTANGLLQAANTHTYHVLKRLGDGAALRKARIHPIKMLSAQLTYASGKGLRGKMTWTPITAIVDALDKAFYTTFQNVKPTGKRLVVGLDVSSSMTWGNIAGVPGITPRSGSAAMALVTAATERHVQFMAFSSEFVPFGLSARQRLDDVIKNMDNMPFGGTDCSQPMVWALKNRIEADAFIIYTDNETWAGNIHPSQALQTYRKQMGIAAKLIVVGMTSNGFSIADPNDAGMLDVVGFDTATPALMADFIRA